RPPRAFHPGGAVAYQIQTKSEKGSVRYKLEAGPRVVSVTAAGRLTWKVPADYAQAETDVLLTVSDATGQEVFHTFKLALSRAEVAAGPRPRGEHAPGPQEAAGAGRGGAAGAAGGVGDA